MLHKKEGKTTPCVPVLAFPAFPESLAAFILFQYIRISQFLPVWSPFPSMTDYQSSTEASPAQGKLWSRLQATSRQLAGTQQQGPGEECGVPPEALQHTCTALTLSQRPTGSWATSFRGCRIIWSLQQEENNPEDFLLKQKHVKQGGALERKGTLWRYVALLEKKK